MPVSVDAQLKKLTQAEFAEVQISVTFKDFCKSYFMDVLASSGAVFELNAADAIHFYAQTMRKCYESPAIS